MCGIPGGVLPTRSPGRRSKMHRRQRSGYLFSWILCFRVTIGFPCGVLDTSYLSAGPLRGNIILSLKGRPSCLCFFFFIYNLSFYMVISIQCARILMETRVSKSTKYKYDKVSSSKIIRNQQYIKKTHFLKIVTLQHLHTYCQNITNNYIHCCLKF